MIDETFTQIDAAVAPYLRLLRGKLLEVTTTKLNDELIQGYAESLIRAEADIAIRKRQVEVRFRVMFLGLADQIRTPGKESDDEG